jgi:hypothetical protein
VSGSQWMGMGEQFEIFPIELDPKQEAEETRKKNFKINRSLTADLNRVRQTHKDENPNMILIGQGKDYLIEKKRYNFEFYTKIVHLIVANAGEKITNADITLEAQKAFPEELINKNIWSKKLNPAMKKSLSTRLKEEWVKLLVKAATLTEFKKMVFSNEQLKSGSMVYKPTIEISVLIMSVNGMSFPIQRNSTTVNSKKHEYAQIRVNLDVFLDALKLKKMSKQKV